MADSVHTIADFLAVVRKSGLVEEARLAAAVAGWSDQAAPLPDALVERVVADGLLTAWQAEQLRKGRHKGFLLGKYRLLSLLGAGGMSSVYLAEHTTLHGKVAIKVLPVKRVGQASYLARFEREAQEAFRLNHPNIVRSIDLDTSGSIHFIAMDYVAGIDLHAKVKRDGPLAVREAADYLRQAALGLQHAHEEGLVHRDIKPANLMLDGRGVVKILDFGLALARSEDGDASLTQAFDEKVLGTADYLAPEQARDSHVADRRSDIYALGCTLHYLLTGRAPFAQGSISERIQAHLRSRPPNLLEARADAPPELVELYYRMMEKNPDARPQSAQEVATALQFWLDATADPAERTNRPAPPRRQPPRRPRPSDGDPGSSNVHYAGGLPGAGQPGSGSGASLSGAGFGSGSMVAGGSAPGPGGRTSPATAVASRPAAGLPSTGDAAFRFDLEPAKPAGGRASPAKKEARGRTDFAGLPLGFWILAGGGLLLAIVLAIRVFVIGRG